MTWPRPRRDGIILSGAYPDRRLHSSLSSPSTSLMHRSPRMIPSRTVFNHCKWIYIELAITGAHSGMGPLCISPAPTSAARTRANVFPISSLRTTDCSNPSTPGIVGRSQPYTSPVLPISFSLPLSSDILPSLNLYLFSRFTGSLCSAVLVLSIRLSLVPISLSFLSPCSSPSCFVSLCLASLPEPS